MPCLGARRRKSQVQGLAMPAGRSSRSFCLWSCRDRDVRPLQLPGYSKSEWPHSGRSYAGRDPHASAQYAQAMEGVADAMLQRLPVGFKAVSMTCSCITLGSAAEQTLSATSGTQPMTACMPIRCSTFIHAGSYGWLYQGCRAYLAAVEPQDRCVVRCAGAC